MKEKSKKKYLAFVASFENNRSFNAFINGSGFLIDKICEKFEKIYIINIANISSTYPVVYNTLNLAIIKLQRL